MFDKLIREEGSKVSSEMTLLNAKAKHKAKRDEERALKIANGTYKPSHINSNNGGGRPKSIVNRVTEYGALFNQLNEQRIAAGLPGMVTAMETLMEAMQPESGLDIKERSRIAEKIATFESSRAPIISIEHVQNISKDDEVDADEALSDFMNALKKV